MIKVLINNERVKRSGEMERKLRKSKQECNWWKTLIESFKLSEAANVYLLLNFKNGLALKKLGNTNKYSLSVT